MCTAPVNLHTNTAPVYVLLIYCTAPVYMLHILHLYTCCLNTAPVYMLHILPLYTCCICCTCKRANKHCVCECLAPEVVCREGGQPGVGPQPPGVQLPAASGQDRRTHIRLAGGVQLPGQHTLTCMHTCTHARVHIHTHTQTHTHTHTHTHRHRHRHTHTCTCTHMQIQVAVSAV